MAEPGSFPNYMTILLTVFGVVCGIIFILFSGYYVFIRNAKARKATQDHDKEIPNVQMAEATETKRNVPRGKEHIIILTKSSTLHTDEDKEGCKDKNERHMSSITDNEQDPLIRKVDSDLRGKVKLNQKSQEEEVDSKTVTEQREYEQLNEDYTSYKEKQAGVAKKVINLENKYREDTNKKVRKK